jgi:hypothetical protein
MKLLACQIFPIPRNKKNSFLKRTVGQELGALRAANNPNAELLKTAEEALAPDPQPGSPTEDETGYNPHGSTL